MPAVDLLQKVRSPAMGGPPGIAAWEDHALKQATAAVQERLRQDCPDLLKPARLSARERQEILFRIAGYLGSEPALRLPGWPLDDLARVIFDHAVGLGPLQPLLDDPTVSEVMVNSPTDVWVERRGRLERTGVRFRDDLHVFYVAQRIFGPLGVQLSAARPLASGRLPGNVRVAASVAPATSQTTISIRKPVVGRLDAEAYSALGSCHPDMLRLLQGAVRGRANLLVAGPTGTGKTTLLRHLGEYLDPAARVVVLEQVAELGLEEVHPHVVAMECAASRVEMADALIHALHRRPDYLVVGEVRGPEALQLLMAMATGHPGMCTVHAQSPQKLFDRLSLAMLQARLHIDHGQLLRYLAEAVDLVAYIERFPDGVRRITQISEIVGYDSRPILRPLWTFTVENSGAEPAGSFVQVNEPSPELVQRVLRWGVRL
jgi:pilus assembly protein CpaF